MIHLSITTIECQTSVPGNRFLDGDTSNGRVYLSPNALEGNNGYSGTWWRIHVVTQESYKFENLGHLNGPRWLCGHPHNNSVFLTPNGSDPGTAWEYHSQPGGNYTLYCLVNGPGGNWLDGNMHNGSVGLKDNTIFFPGTVWKLKGVEGRLRFIGGHVDFTTGQRSSLENAFVNVIGRLKEVPAIDEGRRIAIMRKYANGINVYQDVLGDPSTGAVHWAESRINGDTIAFHSTETWTRQRTGLLSAVIMHELIHLIGENHDPATYDTSIFHQAELFFTP